MTALNWTRCPSGGWWLWDKPQGVPRHPIGSVDRWPCGEVRGRADVGRITVTGRSIAKVKRDLEAAWIAAKGGDA